MYHHSNPIHFHCTGCGRCCLGGDDHYVSVSAKESERIRQYLGLSSAWFRRRYQVRIDGGSGYGIALRNGRCVFLGEDTRCGIYPVRPMQCRTYPYWPELLRSGAAWRGEGRRCEGIDRGKVVPFALVERQLRRQRKAETGSS